MTPETRRLTLLTLPAITLVLVLLFLRGQYLHNQGLEQPETLFQDSLKYEGVSGSASSGEDTQQPEQQEQEQEQEQEQPAPSQELDVTDFPELETHQILYSRSTPDKKYFLINTGYHSIYNANILAHPSRNGSWIVIGQAGIKEAGVYFSELYCETVFKDGAMSCVHSPMTLTIPASSAESCKGNFGMYNKIVGPHDARAFYGPDFPITVYGENARFTCFSQFAVDIRTLMQWPLEMYEKEQFRFPTELQRPPPYGPIEKNWFLWWDSKGQMHAHYAVRPRVFAQMAWDGSVGDNLAPTVTTAAEDEKCLAKYVPVPGERESIHQATNSLSITLCKRADPSCTPTDSNTYIMSVFHHKHVFGAHSMYEPHLMVFKQDSPFTMYGISKKPIWIYGRKRPGEPNEFGPPKPEGDPEMMFITSMTWKSYGQKYHGYLDDEMFLGFGVEDAAAAGIDFVAETILEGLGLC